MRLRFLFGAAAILVLLLAPGVRAQEDNDRGGALGTASDIDRDESPVIIEELPPESGETGEGILSERQSPVQIAGVWVTEETACASGENEAAGFYLTDTLIRWDGGTCNIHNIDSRNGEATIYAQCVGGDGRIERQFQVEMRDDDTLTLRPEWLGAREEFELTRCPGNQ